MNDQNGSEIIKSGETEDEKRARQLDIPLEVWLEMKDQLEKERRINWATAKKYLDGMDLYCFITWWYELEIKYAWEWHHCMNDEVKARMEGKCRRWVKNTDEMPGAPQFKLKLNAMCDDPKTDLRSVLKIMCAIRGNATINGVLLSKRVGRCMFNRFDIRMITDVRREVLRRFAEGRTDAAVHVN